jgi:2-polyprenyl-3-methyl-5-hydroxy-6-metoxy-1,4-benzoquinol methylase
MNASEYLTNHWNRNQVWRNLQNEKHQIRLGKCAGKMEGASFVDVGCAAGHSTEIMARFHPGQWTGIDFDKPTIEMARVNFPEIQFIHLDHVYELSGFLFDGVVCSEVIEHAEDPYELAACLWTITSKVLVVTTPCVPVCDPGHLRLFDESMIADVFKGIPYTVERTARYFYITAKRPA